MRIFWTAICLLIWLAPAHGSELLPDRRILFSEDVDFYGGDLSPIFETSREVCAVACLSDPSCKALTFNTEKSACFPKSAIERREAYVGALSGEVIVTPQSAIELATRRSAETGFLTSQDYGRAMDQARNLGTRFIGGNWEPDTLLQTSRERSANGNLSAARYWLAAALAQLDRSDLWLEFARQTEGLAVAEKSASRQRGLRAEALSATINAHLRSDTVGAQVSALVDMAAALEAVGRGRESIPALRLAQSVQPRADIDQALDRAVKLYGFRVAETTTTSDTAEPQICVAFNEPLDKRTDYGPFVRLDGEDAIWSVSGTQICINGVTHGQRYKITLRAGLPAKSGEALVRETTLNQYVRDRAPSAHFAGRAYVLPRSADAGVPIVTVNTRTVDLSLKRIDDRNLLRTVQEGLFGRGLNRYNIDELDGAIGETVWSGGIDIEDDLNTDITTRIPLGDVIAAQPTGLFALVADVPNSEDGQLATQWFVLSDIGLTTLSGSEGLTVLANRISDAGPQSNAEISLLSRSNTVLAASTADDTGRVHFAAGFLRGTGGSEPAMVLARQGDDLSFLLLTDPAFDLSDRGVEGRASSGAMDVFLTTERGAYLPGDVIHATALVRDARAKALTDIPLTMVLRRPDGVEATRERSVIGAAGGHAFAMPTPPGAPRGTWTLAAYADPEGEALATTHVLVEDFVPERIDVALDLSEKPLNPAALPRLGVQVDYLFGAPGGDLPVETQVRLRQATEIARWPGYQFGRHDARFDPQTHYLAATRTDANGGVQIPVELPDFAANGVPLEAEIIVSASEGSARPVERNVTREVVTPQPLLGIKPEFDGVVPQSSTVEFSAIAFENGVLRELPVTWELNKLRTRYDWYRLHGNWHWEPTVTRERVSSGTLTTGAAPAKISVAVDWGEYELVIRTSEGEFAESAVTFWSGWYAPADTTTTPDTLDVALDRDQYAVGDTAELLIDARHGGTARIAVLSNKVVLLQDVTVSEGESRHRLPVTADWGQGAYVTVQLLRGAEEDRFAPGRSLGLAHAAIDPQARALDVAISVPEHVRPKDVLRPVVKIAGLPAGETAMVRLAAVDVGILNITGHRDPDLTAHYFGKRRLGVEMRDLYGRLIDGTSGRMGQLRQGGDASFSLSQNAPPPSEDLAVWVSDIVEADANGHATLALEVPDFNGTLRLSAMVWTQEGVGQASDEIVVRDPVVIAASMPRFLAPGDSSRLRIDLTHTDGPVATLPLSVSAPGLMPTFTTEIALREGASVPVIVPLSGSAPGDYEVTVSLVLPNREVLSKTLKIGVRQNDPAVSRRQNLTLAAGETLRLDDNVFAGIDPSGAEVLLTAGSHARYDVAGLLTSLDRYGYACTEQLTSRAMPLLYMSETSEALGLTKADALTGQISQTIDRILTRQSASGGFGLWRAGGGDFWLDAYVTDFLSRARASGYSVSDTALTTALDNLSNRVNSAPDFENGGEDIAYALFVLAREGRAAMNDLRYFADEKSDEIGSPLATAQLGAALGLYGDTLRRDELFRKASLKLGAGNNAKTGWRDDYGSTLRDVAGVLALGAASGSGEIDRAYLARQLATAGDRLSTQEQAWMLLAAYESREALGSASVTIDGTALNAAQAARFAQGDAPREITNAGSSDLPLTLTTIGVPQGATEAGGQGYRLTRSYYAIDGVPHSGPFRLGERYVTVIDVTPLRETGARLMINDPLPAGLEIDNPNLLRAGDISALTWLKPAYAQHAEFRSDRFLAAVDLREQKRFSLAYVVRAVSPGNFHHPAAQVEDMYRPEERSQTASSRIVVVE